MTERVFERGPLDTVFGHGCTDRLPSASHFVRVHQ